MNGLPIRVVDFETTGFPPDAAVCEFATVDLVEDDGRWTRGAVRSRLVHPGRPIPPEVSAIHHITDEMVKDAAPFDAGEVYDDSPVLAYAAHHTKFERALLPARSSDRWICTYKVALWLWPEAPLHNNQTLRYWLKLRLSDPAATLTPHRALGDAIVTAAILRRALMVGASIDDMVDVSSRPALLPRLTFGKHAMEPIADVPGGYLEWILKQREMDPDVLHTAFQELKRRRAARATAPANEAPYP